MAVSKIHPIRKTLSKSFDYILDPAKTSNDLYISSPVDFGSQAL